jgi:hypothetical protein
MCTFREFSKRIKVLACFMQVPRADPRLALRHLVFPAVRFEFAEFDVITEFGVRGQVPPDLC